MYHIVQSTSLAAVLDFYILIYYNFYLKRDKMKSHPFIWNFIHW